MPISNDLRTHACVRFMTRDDLPAVAGLHSRMFVGQRLTQLGPTLLTSFYRCFVQSSNAYALVAEADGRVVGFVTATTDKDGLFQQFYRKHLFAICIATISRPAMWATFCSKSGPGRVHLRRFRAAILRGAPSSAAGPGARTESDCPNRLLSIAVAQEHQGTGIAPTLVERLCEAMRSDGITQIGLSVQSQNARAIRFYEKTGWSVERSSEDGVYYIRSTGPHPQQTIH